MFSQQLLGSLFCFQLHTYILHKILLCLLASFPFLPPLLVRRSSSWIWSQNQTYPAALQLKWWSTMVTASKYPHVSIMWPIFCIFSLASDSFGPLVMPLTITCPTNLKKTCLAHHLTNKFQKKNTPWPTRDKQIPKIWRAKAIRRG